MRSNVRYKPTFLAGLAALVALLAFYQAPMGDGLSRNADSLASTDAPGWAGLPADGVDAPAARPRARSGAPATPAPNDVLRTPQPSLQADGSAPAAAAPAQRLESDLFVASELLAGLNPGLGEAAARSLADAVGLELRAFDPTSGLVRLGVPAGMPVADAVAGVRSYPLTAFVGRHAQVRAAGNVQIELGGADVTLQVADHEIWITPTALVDLEDGKDDIRAKSTRPPLADLQWNLWHLGIPDAVEAGLSGEGVVIAVLDTGVAYEDHSDAAHDYVVAPDLAHVDFVAPYDFVNDDAHANDDNGHGTQMTTLMAGMGWTLAIAPKITVMPVKVLDADRVGNEADLIAGIHWAVDNGADIINLSLTFPVGYVPTPAMSAAVARAADEGVLMIAASGNDGSAATAFPAAFPEVLGIGAFAPKKLEDENNRDGLRADYTNGDARVSFLAPGGDHSVDANEDGHPDTPISMTFAAGDPTHLGYWFSSGTSGAAAQTSAVAALLMEGGETAASVGARVHGAAKRFDGSQEIDGARFGGLVRAAEAIEELVDDGPLDPQCTQATLYVNPVGVIIHPSDHEAQAIVNVEVLDANLQPLGGMKLVACLTGTTEEDYYEGVNSDGLAVFKSDKVELIHHPDGVGWQLEIHAVVGKLPGCSGDELVFRPTMLTRIDEKSFQLLSNFGAGMSSSALVGVLDRSVVDALKDVDREKYVDTYMMRTYGTGMSSSALVGMYDYTAMRERELFQETLVFRTFGTGMSSSAIIVDYDFIDPARLIGYEPRELLVRGAVTGTGMSSSAIVSPLGTFSWDYYQSYFTANPGYVVMTHGVGMSSSALVFDRTFLNPARFASTLDEVNLLLESGATVGTGMSSSALVASFTPTTLSWFGYSYDALAPMYLTGVGMSSSALTLDFAMFFGFDLVWAVEIAGTGMSSSALVAGWSPYYFGGFYGIPTGYHSYYGTSVGESAYSE